MHLAQGRPSILSGSALRPLSPWSHLHTNIRYLQTTKTSTATEWRATVAGVVKNEPSFGYTTEMAPLANPEQKQSKVCKIFGVLPDEEVLFTVKRRKGILRQVK